MLTMPREVTALVRICAGMSVPIRIGPMGRPLSRDFRRLKALLEASRLGKTSRFAMPLSFATWSALLFNRELTLFAAPDTWRLHLCWLAYTVALALLLTHTDPGQQHEGQ